MELKYSKTDAGKAVAGKLQSLGIPVGNSRNVSAAAAAKTVVYWRDAAKKGDPDKDDDAWIFYSLLREFRLLVVPKEPRDVIRQKVLDALEHVCNQIGVPNPPNSEIE